MEHMVLFIKEKKGFGEFSQQHTGNHRSCLVGTGVRNVDAKPSGLGSLNHRVGT
jgi:hypothetical protein